LKDDRLMKQTIAERGGDDGIAVDVSALGEARFEVTIIELSSYRALTSGGAILPDRAR
jgi:hypothetical protein